MSQYARTASVLLCVYQIIFPFPPTTARYYMLTSASKYYPSLRGVLAGSGINSDIRHLASSAKTLFELEGVLAVPALLEVQ